MGIDFKSAFEQSSSLVIMVDKTFKIVAASDTYLHFTKTSRDSLSGLDFFDVFPDIPNDITAKAKSPIRASLKRVMKNKISDSITVARYDLAEGGSSGINYYRLCHSPVLDSLNKVSCIIQRVEDITESKTLKDRYVKDLELLKVVSDSEKRYTTMLMESPFAFSVMIGQEMVVTLANDLMKDFWGKGKQIEGKTLLEILPELKDQPFPALIRGVLNTGVPVYANEILARLTHENILQDHYFNIVYQPHHEADKSISGVITIAYEVTEMVLARKKVEESECRFQAAVEAVQGILWTNNAKGEMDGVQAGWASLTGQSYEEYHEYGWSNAIHPDDIASTLEVWGKAVKDKIKTSFEHRLKLKDGSWGLFSVSVIPLLNASGFVREWVGVHTDITRQRRAEEAVKESEKKFKRLVDSMPQKIINADLKGDFTFLNQQWIDETGLSFEELKGSGWERSIYPADLARTKEIWQNSIRSGDIFDTECRIINNNGEYKWNLSRAVPLKDENGAITMWVGSNTDIHEQKEQKMVLEKAVKQRTQELINANLLLINQERNVKNINRQLSSLNLELEERVMNRTRALAESENRFRNMMETLPHIAWTNTIEMEVNFFNQRWYEYTGFNALQAGISQWQNVIHIDDLSETMLQFTTILKTISGGGFQTRIQSAAGEFRWHLIRLMPIKDEKGLLQLWLGTATDIHELKLIQQQKDDFISIASHELKTPITSLKLNLELLFKMKDSLSELMVTRLLGNANNSLDKYIILINDLLNSSKANEGQLHLNKSLFMFSRLIDNCCHYVRIQGVFEICTEGDLSVEVFADEARIEQVVVNFVNNAIKYAPASKEIRILLERLPEAVKISVIDQGPGIPAEKLPYLFGRYYRVDSKGTQYSGLGLGLYIASEIIKKHRGQIGVESEPGTGSVFWFTLPF